MAAPRGRAQAHSTHKIIQLLEQHSQRGSDFYAQVANSVDAHQSRAREGGRELSLQVLLQDLDASLASSVTVQGVAEAEDMLRPLTAAQVAVAEEVGRDLRVLERKTAQATQVASDARREVAADKAKLEAARRVVDQIASAEDSVARLVKVYDEIDRCERSLAEDRLTEAAEAVVVLSLGLDGLHHLTDPAGSGAPLPVVARAQGRFESLRKRLFSRIRVGLHRSVQFGEAEGTVFFSDEYSVDLLLVLKQLEARGLMPDFDETGAAATSRPVACGRHMTTASVLAPGLASALLNRLVPSDPDSSDAAAVWELAVLPRGLRIQAAEGGGHLSLLARLNMLHRALQALTDLLASGAGAYGSDLCNEVPVSLAVEALGDVLRADVLSMARRLPVPLLEAHLPQYVWQLPDYAAEVDAAAEVLERIDRGGWFRAGDAPRGAGDEASPHSRAARAWATGLSRHYCARARRRWLLQARQSLLSAPFRLAPAELGRPAPSPGEGPTDEPKSGQPRLEYFRRQYEAVRADFFRGQGVCETSLSAHSLAWTAYDAMMQCTADGVDAESRVALMDAGRDAVLLHVAVAPTLCGADLAGAPRLAAVFFNDCLLLEHHLLALDSAYLVATGRGAELGFVDLIGQVSLAGRSFLADHVERQRGVVASMLGVGASPLSLADLGEGDRFAVAERTVRQVVHTIDRARAAWSGALPDAATSRIVQGLAELLARSLVDAVLAEEDISAEQGGLMHDLLGIVVENAELTGALGPGVSDRVPSWARLSALHVVLAPAQTLVGIREGFAQGQLNSLLASEVQHLVRALFVESENRVQCLVALAEIESRAASLPSSVASLDS